MSQNYKVEVVPGPGSAMAESPYWDEKSQSLYFIDVYGAVNTLSRYDYALNTTFCASISDENLIGFLIPVEDTTDQFAVGLLDRRVAIIRWDGVSDKAELLRTVFELVEQDVRHKISRWNECKADPVGRLVGGNMRLDLGMGRYSKLYSYVRGEPLVTLITDIEMSCGLTWNVQTGKFYRVDTAASDIKEYDYDTSSGKISNERVVVSFLDDGERPKFRPDGLTIDTEGYLYVSLWLGSKVLRIDPSNGNVLLTIDLPTDQILSLAFGGPNYDELYVTSSGVSRYREMKEPAGSLFRVTALGVRGLPMNKVRL